ncbi:MAG: hypothetical protein HPY79_09515 [Bacteroidales bacterium]|nr:hypothetical protein [Bacteroidales bacterium]
MKNSFLFAFMIAVALTACKKDDTPSTGGSTPTGVTITSTDLGNAGDTMLMNVDTTNLPTLSFAPGQNLTWDISMVGIDKIDTIAFLTPANTPGHSYFPTANIAMQPEAGQPIYMYLLKGTDKVEGLGIWADVQGTQVHAEYTDKPILIKFPMSYNSAYSDSAYLETILNMNGQFIKSEMIQKITSNVDASGTIKLPNSVQFSCIREKHMEININNIYWSLSQSGPWTLYQSSKDTSYDYNFFAKGQKWNVATISVKNFTNNTIKEIAYKK